MSLKNYIYFNHCTVICPKCNKISATPYGVIIERCNYCKYPFIENTGEQKMSKIKKLEDIRIGQKFVYDGLILKKGPIKTCSTCYSCMVIKDCMDEDYKCVEGELIIIHKNKEVNTHWWEALKNPTKIEIMQAHKDGAKIEYLRKGLISWQTLITTAWNWEVYDYRIKSNKHKIMIDDKEIEISEESYKNLKESLA